MMYEVHSTKAPDFLIDSRDTAAAHSRTKKVEKKSGLDF